MNRRTMMIRSGLVITSIASLGSKLGQASQLPTDSNSTPEEKDLQFLTTEPRNGEPELKKLVQEWLTPNELFYVRSHAPNPQIDPNTFRLEVDGLVDNPKSFSLEDLKSLPAHEVTATLTCAGNRRTEFNREKQVGGVQWGPGAIGNAVWKGARLADVLAKVGVKSSAKHVCFEGLDQIEKNDDIIPFGASIPIEKVNEEQQVGESVEQLGALLVYEMNGVPLPLDHGFPLRAIVPGYIGARSVKWLGRVTLSKEPSTNHYVAKAYKIVRDQSDLTLQESGPIYRFPINAALAGDDLGELEPGTIQLQGYVLPSGTTGSRVRRLQVSVNRGESWTNAELVGAEHDYCWRLWKAELEITKATEEIVVRAVDTNGGYMPYRVPWNAKGYLQNSWYRVPIKVN